MARKAYLRTAVKVAGTARACHMLHAAVIYRGGAIMATGYNSHRRHAEVAAVLHFRRHFPELELGSMKMLTIRVGKSGVLRLGKPCAKCQAFLRESGLRAVYYSTDAGLERLRLEDPAFLVG